MNSSQKSLLEQHLRTRSHRCSASEFVDEEEDVERIGAFEERPSTSDFNYDMCLAMVAINAPWNTVNNPIWKRFLEKYTNRVVPDESTIRKNYLDKVYSETVQHIRSEIGENFIWISVDETTDSTGRHIANFIVGKMSKDSPTQPYLLCCKQLDKVNFSTMGMFVSDSLSTLWPQGQHREKVLLLVTDSASYMVKAAESLKPFYPNLKHLTCLVHAIHRIAEEVRDCFPSVDKFISTTKKIFLKCPSRVAKYKEITGNAPLPPFPVITRWGTWIKAAVFFAENFFKIKEVLTITKYNILN